MILYGTGDDTVAFTYNDGRALPHDQEPSKA